jgi:hypothetical protein
MHSFTGGIRHPAGWRPNSSRLRQNGREGADRLGGVLLKLRDARVFNAVTVNPDFGCVEWPGDVDLCPDAVHQAMSGYESETELYSAAVLREGAKKNQ